MEGCGCNNGCSNGCNNSCGNSCCGWNRCNGFDFDMILWVLIIIVIVSFMN